MAFRARCSAKPFEAGMNHHDRSGERLSTLMIAAQGGDHGAYRALLSEATPIVRRSLRRRYAFLAQEDVEDIVQEVLLSVHKVRATYDGRRPFLPWLFAIAHNRTIDMLRRRSRLSRREIAVAEYPETFDDAQTNISDDGYGDPQALHLAVAGLPRGQRVAIEMLRFREMSLKEAASASGMSVAALKVAAHRATKALKAALAGGGDGRD